jgi:hypothetical protein
MKKSGSRYPHESEISYWDEKWRDDLDFNRFEFTMINHKLRGDFWLLVSHWSCSMCVDLPHVGWVENVTNAHQIVIRTNLWSFNTRECKTHSSSDLENIAIL